VSTKRMAVVQGFAEEIVGGAEALAGRKEALAKPLLLGGEPGKLRIDVALRAVNEPDQETFHEGRDGSVTLGGFDASLTIRFVIDGDSDVFHGVTVTQSHNLATWIERSVAAEVLINFPNDTEGSCVRFSGRFFRCKGGRGERGQMGVVNP
jgi:hypothetical protein